MTRRPKSVLALVMVLAAVCFATTLLQVVGDSVTNRHGEPAIGAIPGSSSGSVAYDTVLIKDVPHVRQKPDFCGEACASMAMAKFDYPVDQDYIFDQSGLDPLEGRGCYTKKLARALQRIGFDVGKVWHRVPANRYREHLEFQWKAVHADLMAGVPSIVCTRYDTSPVATEHFRLILGYEAKSDEVIYHEPAEPDGAYRRMRRALLLELWPLKYPITVLFCSSQRSLC